MALILGIDTGGTFTDGVIIDPAGRQVISKAKAFTTPTDLTVGIENCLKLLQIQDPKQIALVSLSTTLATNAIVESKGGRVGLLIIGKAPELKMPVDSWHFIHGKIDIKGNVKEELNESEVLSAIEHLRNHVDAIAISGYASIRNPSHELKVKAIIRDHLILPVVCAHELTSTLGFDDRTVTTVLNASLIPIINALILATKTVLQKFEIQAPVMIVKGDGSLMDESVAVDKPIETILSGPAASIIGGLYLTGQKDAFILDMGGTTTDIAHVENGRSKIRRAGAKVGGWLTYVQAAEICTFGIGGDSYLKFDSDGHLQIGPQKVQPLCVAGHNAPGLIDELRTCRKAADYELFDEQEIDCFALARVPDSFKPSPLDQKIIDLLQEGPHCLFYLARTLGKDAESLELTRLIRLGIILRISMTPTDILHAAGKFTRWDAEISCFAAEILAERLHLSTPEFINTAFSEMVNQLSLHLIESIANFENLSSEFDKNSTAMNFFRRSINSNPDELLKTDFTLNKPIVAIGAPVQAWIPAVGDHLHTTVIIPEHAEVANAIGAAVGEVMESAEVIIRPGREHIGFVLHAPWEYQYFFDLEEARTYAIKAVRDYVEKKIQASGSRQFEMIESQEDLFTDTFTNEKKTYIESRLRVTAIGSPIWTDGRDT